MLELLLNTPSRLAIWCRTMRDLFLQVEDDPQVRCPVSKESSRIPFGKGWLGAANRNEPWWWILVAGSGHLEDNMEATTVVFLLFHHVNDHPANAARVAGKRGLWRGHVFQLADHRLARRVET